MVHDTPESRCEFYYSIFKEWVKRQKYSLHGAEKKAVSIVLETLNIRDITTQSVLPSNSSKSTRQVVLQD
jgi:hypothetical protein